MNFPTGIVTFLFTDIEGSTRLWEEFPDAMRSALARHDRLLTEAILEDGGLVVKSRGEGDSFFAVFSREQDAVCAAVAIQRALLAEKWKTPRPLRVRMALHTAEAELRDGDYYGPAVNRCARLRGIAHGGQTLLSAETAQRVRNRLPEGTSLRDLGWHRLKDLARAEQVFQLLHRDLPGEFAALRSIDTFPNNLPIFLNSFIGREREMAEVRELLQAPATRLVTLTGPGGSGKSRLAIQVAGELIEQFSEGVWFVELAALANASFIIPKIAAVLGIREEPGREWIDTLCDRIAAHHTLLILDNCEHLITASAQVAEKLLQVAGGLKILATSQEILRVPGEVIYSVPSLTIPPESAPLTIDSLSQYEAIRLFVDRAVSADPGFVLNERNARTIAQICQRLDGIPLALELAAARLRVITLDQIASRLDDRFRLLTAGSRTAMPRHQTLRATMDWSYDLCSEPEKALWRHIAVFARGFALDAAETVCADKTIPASLVLECLNALVEKSIVLHVEDASGGTRYRQLSTLVEYGRARMVEAGEAATLHNKHRDFFVGLAERAEPELRRSEQAQWLDRLEAEIDNLRAAIGWSLDSRAVESALTLAGALAYFWLIRAHVAEGKTWLTQALNVSHSRTAARAKALNALGILSYTQGDYGMADTSYRETLAIQRELGNKSGAAHALNNLGNIALIQGNYQRAKDYYEEALISQREVTRTPLLPIILGNLGNVFTRLGAFEQAGTLYNEALALQREEGDKWGMAYVLSNLGEVSELRGDLDLARKQYEESLALRYDISDKLGIAMIKASLGHLASHTRDFGRADTLLKEGLTTCNEIGDRQMIVTVLQYFAELWIDQAQAFYRAVRMLSAVSALRAAMGAPFVPSLRTEFDTALDSCRAGLSVAEFDEAWQTGSKWTFEQAIQKAFNVE